MRESRRLIEDRAPLGVEVVQRPARESVRVDADAETRRVRTSTLNAMVRDCLLGHGIGRTATARVQLALVAISGSAGSGGVMCEVVPHYVEAIEVGSRP